MNYWIFQVNSEAFQVDQFLNSSEKGIWWRVTRFKHEIKQGDVVFFWQSGAHRGIRAIWKIDGGPSILPSEVRPSKFWVNPDRNIATTDIFADCRSLQHFPVLEESTIKQEPGLRYLSIFKFRNATNYPVTPSESMLLRSMIKAWAGGLNEEIPSADVPQQNELTPANKTLKTQSARKTASSTILFQCGACGRFIVSSDTARHIHQAHNGQNIEWKETK